MAEVFNAASVHKDGEPVLFIGIRDGQGMKILYEGSLAKIQTSGGGDLTVECEIKLNQSSNMPGIIVGEKLKEHEDRLNDHEDRLNNHEGRIARLEAMAHTH